METITYLLQFVLFCTFCGVVYIILYFVWCGIKDRREERKQTFSIMHLNIECILRGYPVNEKNQLKLMQYFDQIRSLKYNKEKVEVLWNEFNEKYREFGRELLSEDEHDPSMIFVGE